MTLQTPELTLLHQFAIALLIGALIGTEREKNKATNLLPSFAGIRTFILLAEAGALSAWLANQLSQPGLFIAALLCVLVLVGLAYMLEIRADPKSVGLTTELSALTVFLLGGAVLLGHAGIAIALAIINTSVLAFKDPLHGAVRKLGREDLFAGLKLLVATFIVLPLLPQRAVDPWNVLVPYKLWLLVVLISALSLVGYVAVRWLGNAKGVAVTGFSGGLVSSTAVTLSMAKESRGAGHAQMDEAYAAGVLIAWLVMFLRVVLMVIVLNPAMWRAMLIPFTTMTLTNAAFAAFYYFRSQRALSAHPESVAEIPVKNPFSLWAAFKFGMLFAIVLLAVAIARDTFSSSGMVVVAVLAGTTDVDAISLSMAELGKAPEQIPLSVQAIAAAVLSNTLVKAALAALLGNPGMGRRVIAAAISIASVGLIALFLS